MMGDGVIAVPQLGRIFASATDAHQASPPLRLGRERGCRGLGERVNSLTKLGQGMLAPHAHTVAVDPRTHLVYLPLESESTGKPQVLIMAPI
jgi:hypothetical protein